MFERLLTADLHVGSLRYLYIYTVRIVGAFPVGLIVRHRQ